MKELATEYYKSRKGNCAQAVAAAWALKNNVNIDIKEDFNDHGRGKAPGGICGALYAACTLAGDKHHSVRKEFTNFSSGHITCTDIRKNRIMPCTDCVKIAAKLLEKHNGE